MAGAASHWNGGVYTGPNALGVAQTFPGGFYADGMTIASQDTIDRHAQWERDMAEAERFAQREGEAAVMREMGRQRSFEENSGLKVKVIGDRTLLDYDGRTYTYHSGHAEVSSKAHTGGQRWDLEELSEQIYGKRDAGRLERYIEEQHTGGARARRKRDLERFGRAKKAA